MVGTFLVLSLTSKEYISIAVIIVLSVLSIRVLEVYLKRSLKRSYENLNEVKTNYTFISNSSRFIIFSLAFILIIYNIPPLKSIGLSLFAGAGIFAAILGLASQEAFSNIISGVFIVIAKPFRVGDTIQIGESTFALGTVEDITLRHTVINSRENRKVIIPNSVISSEIIVNSSISDPRKCMHIYVGISYNADIDKAMDLIRKIARKHPNFIDVRTDENKAEGMPDVIVRVIELGEYAVKLRAYIWAADTDKGFIMKCDLLKEIKEEFDKNQIEIPYPYQNVIIKNNAS